MIETLTFICVGFLLVFAAALFLAIIYFLITGTKLFPAILALAFWSFVAYHIGKAVLAAI